MEPLRILFLCSRNRRRSPTAERLFADRAGVETASAGLAPDAEERVTSDLLDWAQLIVVMEPVHRRRLQRQFAAHLRHARVVCLDIPDHYAFMDPVLIERLESRMAAHIGRGR